MGSSVPDNAPPGAEALIEWAEEYADEVGVASAEETGVYEVTIAFEGISLLLAGVLGQGDNPGLWESASLARWNGIETESALQFPEQLPEPPIVIADDDSTLTIQTVNAQIEVTREADSEGGDDGGQTEDEESGDEEQG